ncbi:hypothetical protein [Parvibaculum sp.]|jgi:hypothetical protein|uniref:hypothetical protein n=1 Tax=Parvibaculum sp. TaxID=2024848 RepID=UPI0025E0EC69|nr:hypothetical protein [Parvibaculum sp.]
MENNEQNQKCSIIMIDVAAAQHKQETQSKILNGNQNLDEIMRRAIRNDAAH